MKVPSGRKRLKALSAYGSNTSAKLFEKRQPRRGRCMKCARKHLSAKVCRSVYKHKEIDGGNLYILHGFHDRFLIQSEEA